MEKPIMSGKMPTPKQRRASELNWSIRCLKAMHGLLEYYHKIHAISPSTYSRLYVALDQCMQDIEREHYANGWDGKSRRKS